VTSVRALSPFRHSPDTSGLPHSPDIFSASRHVPNVPFPDSEIADIRRLVPEKVRIVPRTNPRAAAPVIECQANDGVIPELPSAYQTTRLHVAFSEGDTGTLQQLNFLSSRGETRVQPCLLRLVSSGSFRSLFITGSWYHDESIVPHYIGVQFRDSLSPEGLPAHLGVRFLFSLRDAKLLEVERVVLIPGENTVRLQNIRLSNGCPE
jgi:hypothetical protein